MDIAKERDKIKCQVCEGRANVVVFYHKHYPAERLSTYEDPALICATCDKKILLGEYKGDLNKIPTCYKILRGGIEKIYYLTIDSLISMPIKKLAINYFNKNFIRNDLRQKYWRKTIFRLRYIYLPEKKERVKKLKEKEIEY